MSQAGAFDPDVFLAFEYAGWQRVAAQYTDAFADLTTSAAEQLLVASKVQIGSEVLDIATGQGDLAALAAQKGARVKGIDLSDAMLGLARQRYPAIEFIQGNADALPFSAASFDAVVINFGMMHFSRPEQVLRETLRVLRPGGKLSFTVWSPPEEAIGFGITLQALADYGNWQLPLPLAPDSFQFSDALECSRILLASGFSDPTLTRLPLLWELPSADALFEAMYAGTVRTGSMLELQPGGALAAIRQFIVSEAETYRRDGKVLIPMSAVLISTQKL
jgi:SAM-dependent methyltransferase